MPQYNVIAKGYHGDNIYDPEGKRNTLTTDVPFENDDDGDEMVPSWLERMDAEPVDEVKVNKSSPSFTKKASKKTVKSL